MSRQVLVSWIAVNNDPYERDQLTGIPRVIDGSPVLGPTLTLLSDPDSPYSGSVSDFVVFYARSPAGTETRQSRAVSETLQELTTRTPSLRIHEQPWNGTDPTDHGEIFSFLRERLAAIRKNFAGRELVIHVSPGTPSMQTVLVLMCETGFIDPPFSLVKSYRAAERNGRPAVVPVQLGIDTYYKVYRAAHPAQIASEDAAVVWDPARFKSAKMRRIFDEARRVAQLKVPVLLLGERGTGKTTLAGWIRSNSRYRLPERDAAWPAVACGQYNPETMRAELFGYRRGSFTGAEQDREGLLAIAHKDTLFLDEIGDISRDLQRLLIKAVEEKIYMRLGDDRPLTSDFRLISATNLSDAELHRRLDFDFFDRISMFTLRLPPLREVSEEIPWLWDKVFNRAVSLAGAGHISLPDSAHKAIVSELTRHALPGNLRDLFRVAYRTIAAKADYQSPMSNDQAIEYGLEGIYEPATCATEDSVPKSIARAFADSSNLDSLITQGTVVQTKLVERALKAYLADQIRGIAKKRGLSPEELCDVTDRALRDWLADRERK